MQLSNKPAKIVLPFAASGSKNTIPVPSQIGITAGAASYTDGFPPLTRTPPTSGGTGVAGLDMNGILNEISAPALWACAGGGFPYDSVFSAAVGGYPQGARVLRADGTGYWFSTTDNNTTDPDTGGAGWIADATVIVAGTGITISPSSGRGTVTINSTAGTAIDSLTGDVTATGPGAATATLAASGVTPGTYTSLTVDAKGRATAGTNPASGFTSGSGSNGYWVKDPTGHIHQWGFSTAPGATTIWFPIPFTVLASIIPSGSPLGTTSQPSAENPPLFWNVTLNNMSMNTNSSTGASWTADGY